MAPFPKAWLVLEALAKAADEVLNLPQKLAPLSRFFSVALMCAISLHRLCPHKRIDEKWKSYRTSRIPRT